MPKKWILVAAGVTAVAILLVVGQLLQNRSSPTTNPAEQTAANATATPGAGGAAQGPASSATGAAGTTASAGTPGVVAPLPGGKPLAPITPSGPAKPGFPLHPLATSPRGLISGVSASRIPWGSVYTVEFRPWGYGPVTRAGQTIAISLAKATPVNGAPDISTLLRNPLLCAMDARQGGNVAVGGVHTGSLTFIADGPQLVPVLTKVQAFAP